MTKTSPHQDKTENLKTQTRQKWDSGQKSDTFETKVGQNWDKMRTVDKNETKVGILTLATSTGFSHRKLCGPICVLQAIIDLLILAYGALKSVCV